MDTVITAEETELKTIDRVQHQDIQDSRKHEILLGLEPCKEREDQ